MKPINLQIKDLINDKEKLTFLVGAGCSIDSPSCLPAGRAMMNAIIDYVCPQSEINKIKNLEQLRFEALVEIVRDTLDNDLKLIDYYGLCEKPNIQHFFFAEMIKKGHFVMTTNFDFLLEHALLQSGVPKDEIIVAITKEDFVNYQNPVELYENNKKTLYKIHGSTQNIITEKSTKDSLVATIQAFGSNKQGLNMFQIESFKQNLFKNITKDRSLVIIGYSGSDDFDVVPTLKELKNLNNVIWIDFKKDVENQEQIFEIDKSTLDKDKVNQVLIELKQTNNAKH
ncbi:MAG: SIR2 family protein, partial [Promethearchaeota archaeon]